ncbi:MAG: protein kinase domain-containing protein [Planctomycetota bacterium]|jgi:serine/threonine-protein kinase
MEPITSGSRWGDLEIVRELGRGAYGIVYLAQDTLLGRPVALKVLRTPGHAPAERERERMLREARLIGRLTSPHIATLYRVHALPGGEGWVFEMEYVEGGSLQALLGTDRRLIPAQAADLARGILAGLKEAHAHDVVHGDLKPGNVLLSSDRTAKLVDFGLSRLMGDISLTHSDDLQLIGTPLYMAPEVVTGERPSAASDLWSAGVMLYRMLTGRFPFAGKTLPALSHAVQTADPPPLAPGLPPALADLTMRCLAKSPAERPASCEGALVHLLPGRVAEAAPLAAGETAAPAPRLFGRERERERLQAAAVQVAGGRGATVLVSGETGMGKTLLAQDAAAYTRSLHFRWIEARVTSLEGLLRPLLIGLRGWLTRGGAGAEVSRLWESKLFGTATELLRHLLEEQTPLRIESREQIFWGVARLLAGLAEEGPLGVLIEDAHEAQAEDQRLLREIARRLARSRVLLLITFRSLDAEGPALAKEKDRVLRELATEEAVVHLHLGPLAADAVAHVLEARTENARIAPEVLQHVLHVAEGNPLFTVELLRHLLETRAVERRDEALRPGPAWTRTTLPRRLRELVLLRLRGLPEEQRTLLDVAAVDGLSFEGQTLADALDRPLLDVLRALQEIYRRTGLIVPRSEGYRFANAVLQEGIYEELAPDLRRALHQRLAEGLEDQPAVQPARLATHWEGANRPELARPCFRRAAHEALRRQDQLRAVDFTRRAGLAPGQLEPAAAVENAELLLDVTGSYLDLGRAGEAEAILDALLEGAEAAGDELLRLKVLVRRTATRYQTRGLIGVDEPAVREAAERLPPSVHKGRALYLLGQIAKYRGDLDEAERRLRAADEVYVACSADGPHASALDQLGSVALRRGRWEEAEALYGDASRICHVAGQRTNAAVSEINRIFAAYQRGALDDLLPRLQGCMRELSLAGATNLVAHASVHLAYLRYASGETKAAQAAVAEALPVLRRTRYLMGLVPATIEHAHLAAVTGYLDLAEQTLDETRRLAELTEDYASSVHAALLEGQITCVRGDPASGRRLALRALELARTHPDLPPRLRVVSWLAEGVLYGLPADLLADAQALLREVADPAVFAVRDAICRGAAALVDPSGSGDALWEAARALRSHAIGPRRAALRVLATRVAAEAYLRAGNVAGAREEAERGVANATALGHVWLEAHLRQLLGGLEGGGVHAARLEQLVRGLARRLGSAEERRQFLRSWSL